MEEVLRSNDPVLLSFATSLLKEAEIAHWVVDDHMSVLEGSLGVLARRLLVPEDARIGARRLLTEAGLGADLTIER